MPAIQYGLILGANVLVYLCAIGELEDESSRATDPIW